MDWEAKALLRFILLTLFDRKDESGEGKGQPDKFEHLRPGGWKNKRARQIPRRLGEGSRWKLLSF